MNFSGVSKPEQPLLVLHDQVVGLLGVVAVALVVLGGVSVQVPFLSTEK